MPRYAQVSTLVSEHGLLAGERRSPTNFAAWRTGGIHDDKAARTIGFKGGLVSGLIHNEQFMPLALQAFGPRWFERGCYSFFYRTPTYDLESVQAFMCDPGGQTDNVQVDAWSETEDRQKVAEGTISMGQVSELTALRRRFEERPASGELRIFRDVQPGQSLGEVVRRFPLQVPPGGEGQISRRENTTEPLEWYFGDSPWGRPIANSMGIARLMRPSLAGTGAAHGLGLDGGIEVRFVNGPIFLDKDYILTGRILGTSQSPKTENVWWESSLRDPETDTVVAQMFMMSCAFKRSSPLYADQ